MAQATLIAFWLPRMAKSISMGHACKFYRKLYGYKNASCYGRYHTWVPGLLDNIKHIRHRNGLIIVGKNDAKKIVNFLRRYKATVLYWEVIPSKKEAKLLGIT